MFDFQVKPMIDKTLLQSKIEELQAILTNQETAFDYEKEFDKKWRGIGREVFQQRLGGTSQDCNKKKHQNEIWADLGKKDASFLYYAIKISYESLPAEIDRTDRATGKFGQYSPISILCVVKAEPSKIKDPRRPTTKTT